MKRILIAPAKYVQGEGEYERLGEYLAAYGDKVFFIAHEDDRARMRPYLNAVEAGGKTALVYGDFSGECTLGEIEKFSLQVRESGCGAVAGLGGGKALDTAKAVAHAVKQPVIVLPTIASTDAPCSSLAVVYTARGQFSQYIFFNKNPDLVLVDTRVIANAPVRFLVAGIGDALATWFEARACLRSHADNIPGGKSTRAALAVARQCYDTLREDSLKAVAACECNVVTPALENIVEANILLSGLGFESSGLAAAHAVHDGLTALEETHRFYHGEKVAFGVLVQLMLENAPLEEIGEVGDFCRSVGLPVCLADIGVEDAAPEKIRAVAEAACAPGETMGNMPFPVTPDDVFAAILAADRMGRE